MIEKIKRKKNKNNKEKYKRFTNNKNKWIIVLKKLVHRGFARRLVQALMSISKAWLPLRLLTY